MMEALERPIEEISGAWRDESMRFLRIEPASDRAGVLGDVHWSIDGLGHFTTYALGDLYDVQFDRV